MALVRSAYKVIKCGSETQKEVCGRSALGQADKDAKDINASLRLPILVTTGDANLKEADSAKDQLTPSLGQSYAGSA